MRPSHTLLGAIALASIGLNAFFLVTLPRDTPSTAPESTASTVPSANVLPYLSPRIFAERQNDILINFVPLRDAMRQYVEQTSGHVGVYFEYLPTGSSIGVNEKQSFVQASLIKLPLAMAVSHVITKGRMRNDATITIKKEHIDQRFGQLWKEGEGGQHTVEDLLTRMLKESDNTAANALGSLLDPGELDNVFNYLDIPVEKEQSMPLITPKNYSSIFRSLYLSSYLPKEDSNRMLEILTQTPFSDKLVAGVPGNIKVAHKIGVYNVIDPVKTLYSDCGIVYAAKRPYILCVMANEDEAAAREHMKTLSTMVYGYLAAVNAR